MGPTLLQKALQHFKNTQIGLDVAAEVQARIDNARRMARSADGISHLLDDIKLPTEETTPTVNASEGKPEKNGELGDVPTDGPAVQE